MKAGDKLFATILVVFVMGLAAAAHAPPAPLG